MIVPLLSFFGAMLGAAVPAFVALRGQRQTARVEWRQRLDKAIDLVASERPLARKIGDGLLADLITSDLGTRSDRQLAEDIARTHLEHD
jgi:hypothetical protein